MLCASISRANQKREACFFSNLIEQSCKSIFYSDLAAMLANEFVVVEIFQINLLIILLDELPLSSPAS